MAFMPDSEQILLTGTKYRKQNSVSVEQIQDNPTTRPIYQKRPLLRSFFYLFLFSESVALIAPANPDARKVYARRGFGSK